jgi:hypothetical protein
MHEQNTKKKKGQLSLLVSLVGSQWPKFVFSVYGIDQSACLERQKNMSI